MSDKPTNKQLQAAIELITNRLPFQPDYCKELGMSPTAFIHDAYGEHAPAMAYQTRWAGEVLFKAIITGVKDA